MTSTGTRSPRPPAALATSPSRGPSHAGQNIAAVFVATYTDAPGGGETPQQGSDEVILQPGT